MYLYSCISMHLELYCIYTLCFILSTWILRYFRASGDFKKKKVSYWKLLRSGLKQVFSCPNRALTSSSCPSSSSCCCYCTALISGTIAVWRATTSTTSSCPDASLPPSDPRPAASLQQRGMHTSLNTAAKKAYLNQPNLCVYASVVTWSTTSWKNFLGALKSFFFPQWRITSFHNFYRNCIMLCSGCKDSSAKHIMKEKKNVCLSDTNKWSKRITLELYMFFIQEQITFQTFSSHHQVQESGLCYNRWSDNMQSFPFLIMDQSYSTVCVPIQSYTVFYTFIVFVFSLFCEGI